MYVFYPKKLLISKECGGMRKDEIEERMKMGKKWDEGKGRGL